MAFTVEDGSGLAGANALASTADVSAYLQDRGHSAWLALTTEQQQAAIIASTDYLSSTFDWKGDVLSDEQALALPTDEVDAPAAGDLLAALARVAYAVGVGKVDLFGTVSAQALVKSVKAGSVAVEFDASALQVAGQGRPDFPWLGPLLAAYIDDGADTLSRKVVRT